MRFALALVTIALSPVLLAAQERATTSSEADARITSAIARLEAEGIGTSSLLDRVRLGRMRGVPPLRVAAAVEQRAHALHSAWTVLRVSADDDVQTLLELGANAIESGTSASQVAAVATGFEVGDRRRAMVALATLAAEGRIGDDAFGAVRAALDGQEYVAGAGAAEAMDASSSVAGQPGITSSRAAVVVGTDEAHPSLRALVGSGILGVLPR